MLTTGQKAKSVINVMRAREKTVAPIRSCSFCWRVCQWWKPWEDLNRDEGPGGFGNPHIQNRDRQAEDLQTLERAMEEAHEVVDFVVDHFASMLDKSEQV